MLVLPNFLPFIKNFGTTGWLLETITIFIVSRYVNIPVIVYTYTKRRAPSCALNLFSPDFERYIVYQLTRKTAIKYRFLMEQSAIQRTPIEIWTIVLHYSLATPSFPFTNDSYGHLDTNIQKNINLFPFECDLYREFLSMKNSDTSARLSNLGIDPRKYSTSLHICQYRRY
jgi:hypothetical protein